MPPLTWGKGGGGNVRHGTKSCASEIPLPQSTESRVTLRVDYQSRYSSTAMEIARNSSWVHQCSLWPGGQKKCENPNGYLLLDAAAARVCLPPAAGAAERLKVDS